MSAQSFRDVGAGLAICRQVGRKTGALAIALAMLGLAISVIGATPVSAEPDASSLEADSAPIVLAQDGGTEPRELEPAYDAPPPGKPGPYNEQEGPGYNSDYLFGITRSVVNSTIVPAGKVPLFLLTVPLDIVFLPFAAIGGFFG